MGFQSESVGQRDSQRETGTPARCTIARVATSIIDRTIATCDGGVPALSWKQRQEREMSGGGSAENRFFGTGCVDDGRRGSTGCGNRERGEVGDVVEVELW